MTRDEMMEAAKRAAEEAMQAYSDKELAAASTVKVESGGKTSEFKLNGLVIAAIAAIAALFGYDMDQEQQMQLFQHVSTMLGGIGAVYTTARTWRKNQTPA